METANTTMETGMIIADDNGLEGQLTSRSLAFCSAKPKTDKEKIALYNAVNNPTQRLKEAVNIKIPMKDLYAENVTITDSNTGEFIDRTRLVVIAADGTSYQSVGVGVFGALKKIFGIFGTPEHWETPLVVTPRMITTAKGQTVTLDVDGFLPKK